MRGLTITLFAIIATIVEFPYPLEETGGYYHPLGCSYQLQESVSVPSRGEWGVLLKSHWKTFIQCCVSVPSRGDWGF